MKTFRFNGQGRAGVKTGRLPGSTDEERTYTPDEAGTFCQLVRKRLNAPRLTR